jgi:circadian clock protein KaiB
MSQVLQAKRRPGKGRRGHYLLRQFIAGDGPNSRQALLNLRRLCQEYLDGRHTIEMVDVAKDFQAAIRDNILVTPALILVTPRPRVTILGTLGDLQKVLVALRLAGSES